MPWTFLFLAAAAGAILGLGAARLLPPRYEAAAVLPLSIDYGRTVPLELVVEDRLLDRVWAYLNSDAVLDGAAAVLTQARGGSPSWSTPGALRRHTRLEARLSRWTFLASDESPEVAAAIANAWAESAHGALAEAMDHAWRAVELQKGALYPNCFQVLDEPTRDQIWECFSRGPQVDPQLVPLLRSEIEAAHGISPMISFEAVEPADPPEAPTLYAQGWLTLAGAMIGLVASTGATTFLTAAREA